ncbi:choline transport protein [Colletotrichum chrysophilum]|uniref:Choline transport protein n=2 Tax=Colletotrichum chrysophilum TaxID=1836956 RepID=A0AAD9ENE4_9PEZI|nr:choline transport protein [Colletotrichum chrysophilum]
MSQVETPSDHLPHTFGLWSGISIGWLTLNVFGGMSFILFVGLSAGGIPAILYGFIGSSICVLCIIITFAQCAARYSTAGGAYHYATFLIPERYRRQCAYPLGWLNYCGWVLTHAACCAIVATLTLALVNLCQPEFDVTTRWQLFLVYLAMVFGCCLINLFGLRGIPTLELVGCWATVFVFVAYTIALLVKAPKATPHSVFVQTNNDTGYSSTGFAILLGLFNSFSTLMGLDCPTHLAEEVKNPKKVIPRILLIVIISQFFVGVVWILVLGFSIGDLPTIIASPTGVPILELIRLGTGSDAAAIVFCIILIINQGASALGSAVTMSRQGYAFARDGGLFWNHKLTELSPRTQLPVWSINVPSALVALIGLIYLFSNAAFNAIIGSQAVCMIISFGCPALIMLLTKSSTLPESKSWNFGRLSTPIYVISSLYSLLVVIVALIPQVHPVTTLTMNYTSLIMGVFGTAMTVAWFSEGRRLFSPPTYHEIGLTVMDGLSFSEGQDEETGEKRGGQVKVGDGQQFVSEAMT